MENKGDAIGLSIPGLLVLLTIVGLNLFDEPRLKSNRPPAPKLPDVSFSDQQIPARLWQDPFGAVSAYPANPLRAASPAVAPAPSQAQSQPGAPPPRSIQEQISERLDRGDRLTILPVMLPSQRYTESAEGRIRVRYAVLSGLDVAGYVPVDPEHLGYLPSTDLAGLRDGIPYEWFSASADAAEDGSVLVLWLSDGAFGQRPIGALTDLLAALLPFSIQVPRIRVLGPGTSDGVVAMLREASSTDRKVFSDARTGLPNLAVLSPNATAADADLLARAGIAEKVSVEDVIGQVVPFKRTILSDDVISKALVGELVLRGFGKGQAQGVVLSLTFRISKYLNTLADNGNTRSERDRVKNHVVLLAEWDTTYGRSLPLSVGRALSDEVLWKGDPKVFTDVRPLERLTDLRGHPWIHYISYMRGLDGDAPAPANTTPAKAPDDKADKKGSERQGDSAWSAEGPEQLDYVRRLARDLLALELDLKRQGGRERIFAIGILGSDVHDKLLILQALRPSFPSAVFFTTDLDARLLDPSQAQWTRGLIVASAFALRQLLSVDDPVQDRRDQWPIPPFRSSYQTSYFCATRAALQDDADHSTLPSDRKARKPAANLKIYELGRSAPVLLAESADGNATRLPGVVLTTVLAVLLVLLLVFLYRRDSILPTVRRLGAYLALYPLRAVAIGVGFAAWVWYVRGDLATLTCPLTGAPECKEPFSLSSGISIWPAMYLQTLALVLSVVFWLYVFLRVRGNAREVEREYFPQLIAADRERKFKDSDLLDRVAMELQDYARALRNLKRTASEWMARFIPATNRHRRRKADPNKRAAPADALAIWRAYQQRVTGPWRLFRVLLLAIPFYFLVVSLYLATGGGASNPVRGLEISGLYTSLRLLDLLTMALLAFGVLDAALQCRAFINTLAAAAVSRDAPLQWPSGVVGKFAEREAFDCAHIQPWIALRLIADHADAIARLVVYPLIVLLVLVVARLSWFDTVTMPVSVLVAYVLFGFYILLAAWSMQRAANAAKQAIHAYYVQRREQEENRQSPDTQTLARCASLANKVANLQDGAFKPLAQMPLVRAALLPFGALGVGLLDLFT